MNIAILIGASNYKDPANNLPGCKNDLDFIFEVVSATSKYSSILKLDGFVESGESKEKIIDFLDNIDEEVNEIFFYYTGHGKYDADDFYYIMSDYDRKKPKRTSLENSELDSWLKSKNPKLVVKIIDACQAGISYIKEVEVLEKYFNKTTDKFNSCYFMFSCLKNQSSYQTAQISFFTKSLLYSLKESKTKTIRYKDLIDYVSEEFDGNKKQKPYFVVQGDFTEKFFTKSTKIDSIIAKIVSSLEESKLPAKLDSASLLELVQSDAKKYVDEKQAQELLKSIKDHLPKLELNDSINEIFKIHIDLVPLDASLNSESELCKYAESEVNSDFFVEVNKDVEYYEYEEYPHSGVSSYRAETINLFAQPLKQKRPYTIYHGYQLKFNAPYKAISIDLVSNYGNILDYNLTFAYFMSKTAIKFMSYATHYTAINWEEKEQLNEVEWRVNNFDIIETNEVIQFIENRFEKFCKSVHSEILKIVNEDEEE